MEINTFLKTYDMKKIAIIAVIILINIGVRAQYHKYYNSTEKIIYGDSSSWYIKLKPVEKQRLQQLSKTWVSEDNQFRIELLYKEKHEGLPAIFNDELSGLLYIPGLGQPYEIAIGGTKFDDINQPNVHFFRAIPQDFSTVYIRISGFATIVPLDEENNALTLEIKGVGHPPADDEELVIYPDYLLSEAPDSVKQCVPGILLQKNPITFVPETMEPL